jgi:phage portal protein BeeE
MADKIIFTDGRGVKTINPFDLDSRPEAWETIGKPPDPKETDPRLVSTVYAALDKRYKAAADMPFSIYAYTPQLPAKAKPKEEDKEEKALDDSDDYQNVIGFLPDPSAFFGLCELAIAAWGRAYYFRQINRNKFTLGLRYWLPSSVTVEFNDDGTLKQFIRKTRAGDKPFPPEQVFHIWLPDDNVEAGAPTLYPLKAALVSAGALQYINLFVRDYMQRGAVKAMILALDGNPPPDERNRIEAWFNTFMRGARNMVWRAFNLKSVTPTIIGEGLEALKDIGIKESLKIDILEALGVPPSLIGNAGATREGNARKEDERHFVTNTIIPDMRIIQQAFNTQILHPMGYRLQFEPDRLEALQKDESEKITALSTLINAVSRTGVPPEKMKAAIEISGLIVTDEQMAALTKEIEPDKPKPKDNAKYDAAMDKFKRKALKHIGEAVDFIDDEIPNETVAEIQSQLIGCKTAAEVRAVFDAVNKPDDAAAVLQGIRLALTAMMST